MTETDLLTDLLMPGEAAELLHVSPNLLKMWRYRGVGPPFVKLGPRAVRYRVADIAAWLDANVVTPGQG